MQFAFTGGLDDSLQRVPAIKDKSPTAISYQDDTRFIGKTAPPATQWPTCRR